jgi:1-acyl-sn-glycerol-3-phosphate acyltransferase/MFS family permease
LNARLRLASLWVSQVSRVLSDCTLRFLAALAWAGAVHEKRLAAWHVAVAAFIAPYLVLAPLNGGLSNALPRRWVLSGSALFSLLTVGAFALLGGSWLLCLLLVAVAAAVNSPARYAILPAAAEDTRIPLPRVNGWIEMGAAAAIVGGVVLGGLLPEPGWPGNGAPLAGRAVAVLVGLNLLSFLTALPTAFPSDLRRPETPGRAIAGFFRDSYRIARQRQAAGALLGLAGFQALVVAGSGALLAYTLGGNSADDNLTRFAHSVVLIGIGAVLGCAAASLVSHPFRNLGLVPFGSLGLLVALGWTMLSATPGEPLPLVPCLLLGFMSGLVNVPLRAAYLGAVPADARGNATSVMNATIYILTALLAGLIVALVGVGALPSPLAQLQLLAGLAALGAGAACWLVRRNALELIWHGIIVPQYRVRAHGPGVATFPRSGPVLLVANHAAYGDPFWLGVVVPRAMTPMMTSFFYDRPVIHFIMSRVIGAIRVPQSRFRREIPELRDAVEALRRGECLLIFPEARLRRNEEPMLRPFGQGVWHILREQPDTPVVVCWIEGSWGSYLSYCHGPPFTNKRPDFRRRIDIAFAEPKVLDPSVLADARSTRKYLMRACLECRKYLGLAVPDQPSAERDPEPSEIDAPPGGVPENAP